MGKFVDLKDKQFGLWTVLYRVDNHPNGKTQWMCRCDCGTTKVITGNSLRSYNSTSCGCNNTANLVGKQYGDLQVVTADHTFGRRLWCCRCACGEYIVATTSDLRNRTVTTCSSEACLRRALEHRMVQHPCQALINRAALTASMHRKA